MTPFLLISASGATLVSPGVDDAALDAMEGALGGELEAAFVISSPTDAGDLVAYALAEPLAEPVAADGTEDGISILFTLPSGDVVGVRGRVVVTATDREGAPRALSAAELQRLWPQQLSPHVHIMLGAA